jgi:hypothetical protein
MHPILIWDVKKARITRSAGYPVHPWNKKIWIRLPRHHWNRGSQLFPTIYLEFLGEFAAICETALTPLNQGPRGVDWYKKRGSKSRGTGPLKDPTTMPRAGVQNLQLHNAFHQRKKIWEWGKVFRFPFLPHSSGWIFIALGLPVTKKQGVLLF